MRPSAGRLYSQKITSVQSKYLNRRIIVRAKALVAVVLLAFYFAGSLLFAIVSGRIIVDALGGSLTTLNAALQVAASGYFIVAKDRNTTALTLRYLMLVAGVQLPVGITAYGSLKFTILALLVQYFAYRQVSALKDMM